MQNYYINSWVDFFDMVDVDEERVISLGPELLLNGNFDYWTSDDPDDWAVAGESGSDPEISEGTGCLIYSSGAWWTISQYVLTVGKRYRCSFELLSAIDMTAVWWGNHVVQYYNLGGCGVGVYSFEFICRDNTAFELIGNIVSLEIDNVSVREIL